MHRPWAQTIVSGRPGVEQGLGGRGQSWDIHNAVNSLEKEVFVAHLQCPVLGTQCAFTHLIHKLTLLSMWRCNFADEETDAQSGYYGNCLRIPASRYLLLEPTQI